MAGQLAASIATARASGFPPFVLDVRGNDGLGDAGVRVLADEMEEILWISDHYLLGIIMNNYYVLGVRVLADEMEAGGALSLCGVGATLDSEGVLDMGWQVIY